MVLYHYTTMQALLGILRKEHLCFWGTRYDTMNDPVDYIYAHDIVIPQLLKSIKDTPFEGHELVRAFPYIVSFCKSEDDFNMWRMYKSEVSLEINWDIVNESFEKEISSTGEKHIYWGDCMYPESHAIPTCFTELFNKAEQTINNILDTAQECVTLIKRKEFVNENEFRIFSFDYNLCRAEYNNGNPVFIDCEIGNNVKVRCVKDNDLVLYKEFNLPPKALSAIMLNISDKQQFEKAKSHLQVYLGQLGYHVDIKQSVNGLKVRS